MEVAVEKNSAIFGHFPPFCGWEKFFYRTFSDFFGHLVLGYPFIPILTFRRRRGRDFQGMSSG